MKKESNTEIMVKFYYTESGADIRDILENSILLFIGNEVKKNVTQATDFKIYQYL